MAKRIRRRNEKSLDWLKSAFVGVLTYLGLSSMAFVPGWGAAGLGVTAGLLTLAAADLGVLTALLAFTIPVTAADPVAGIAFLVLGVVGMRYLGSDGGRVFVIVGLALVGVVAGPAWAAAAIAGYLLGASEGALAAGIACATVELAGLLTGHQALGALTTGGSESTRLLAFGEGLAGGNVPWPSTFFTGGWLKDVFAGFGADSVQRFVDAIAALDQPVALAVQPLLWALAAVVTGVLVKRGRAEHKRALPVAGAGFGVLMPALGALVLASATGTPVDVPAIGMSAAGSLVVAVAFVAVAEHFFPLEVVTIQRVSRPASMATEDADVDELLRLISSAEEKLTTQHTTQKVVMITDMKSFSRMTEEDGSIMTAKAIQKHRDLLIPLIEKHGGHGKSTGGDGLVAAFDSAEGALAAAAEMQRALDAHNAAHADERQMTVRIGVADGEVVLDNGGRPFIGAALNLAARVMNLADGGQAFTTAAVAEKAGGVVTTAPLGEFDLKNIAKPVPVVEILWAPGQEPVAPLWRDA